MDARSGIRCLRFPQYPDHDCIWDVCRAADGRIHGATQGARTHLFAYDLHPSADHVIDLGVVAEQEGVCNRLVVTQSGRIVVGTTQGYLIAFSTPFCAANTDKFISVRATAFHTSSSTIRLLGKSKK